MQKKNTAHNPLTSTDERGHAGSILEWWAEEAFFISKEDQKHWSLKFAISEGYDDPQLRGIVSLCNITLFDQDENKHYVYYVRSPGARLQVSHDEFHVRLGESFMKGSHPTYHIHVHDPDHNIEIDFLSQAESFPHWVAQDVTHGWIPMGIGFYRYGFIPKTRVSGTMTIQGKQFTIEGKGYFEHVWGNFDYEHPLSTVSGLFKTIWLYKKLGFWWLQNHTLRIPESITLATENNPLGYDWVWAVLDNGWSIFYGNALFWVMDGPAAGVLVLSKDGKTFTEFSDITFHYRTIISAKDHDFYYPSELEIITRKGKETLHLLCSMTSESREYLRVPRAHSFWLGLAICEAPGIISGWYTDGVQRIPISGVCKIEPQRELSTMGHNVLKIDCMLPPRGFGLSFNLESHFFKKKIHAHLQFVPRLSRGWKMQRIDPSAIRGRIG
jgi:hypothetical protein